MQTGIDLDDRHPIRTIYLNEHRARLSLKHGALVVTRPGESEVPIPTASVDQISVLCNATLTTPALKFCMDHGIRIGIFSSTGRLYGTADGMPKQLARLQIQQLEQSMNPMACLEMSKTIVAAKIHNSRQVLSRYHRRGYRMLFPVLEALSALKNAVSEAHSPGELRGIEGTAARQYWSGFRLLLPEHWDFQGRRKHPAPDPLNAMLSFGYSLLYRDLLALVQARGLNPNIGFYHVLRDGHPALISDLAEEFRAPIVDRLVLRWARKPDLNPDAFATHPDGACRLPDALRRDFINDFEAQLEAGFYSPKRKQRIHARVRMDEQVRAFIRWLGQEDLRYQPVTLR